MTLSVVILAAGQGTRMKSNLPKVLHPLGGRPLVQYSVETGRALSGGAPVLVIGHGGDTVKATLGDQCEYVVQAEQLGTAHAVLQARDLLQGRGGLVLVYYADMPLLTAESLGALVEIQKANSGPLSLITMVDPDPRGFGRILRDSNNQVQGIVEEAQATPEQKTIRELNVGAYCINADYLWQTLPSLPASPKGEYYITDLIGAAIAQGLKVEAVTLDDNTEAIGINTRVHLAEAEAILRRRLTHRWLEAGVSMIDPATVYIEPGVTLAPDTTILPNVQLLGNTQIGTGCTIGPNTYVRNSTIGDYCQVVASYIEDAVVENSVDIGPYSHLRAGAHLADGVHLGNFGEVKESYLGPGVKMGHFSYIGNARLGSNVNVGAGTITCNFDGIKKNTTIVEDDVFIGSDSMLVAPVTLGEGSRTGAGSVVTKNVPPKSLAVGLPARVIRKL
jgi:bifunctional UDP-N-acetylglucosamine pyrophosphorylase/glucosamine-1-phosphate N-acetyltransferase